jgi:hypothetical protein
MTRGTLENIKISLQKLKKSTIILTYSQLRLLEYLLNSLSNHLEADSRPQKLFLRCLGSMESYLGSAISDIRLNQNIWQQPRPGNNVV